ncbi:DUF1254 domain-containing protein [Sinorhizobium sp. BG8]|uniref:DUF1254 domain-containing protein n=1 Tax=Sinorhizobium sp. BG8 TaxID=2613773 RepID=UPI00193EA0A4|nr:DUF1254 domain-containing protein [Sinorhizobium sp. BG8]QRM55346.1 DUF1254 domain-containing protein [Sinorhizobium sp. BG8]
MASIARTLAVATMVSATAAAFGGYEAAAETEALRPPAILTPDTVDTRIGKLEFNDGAPSSETLQRVYDNLDFSHAFEAFMNTMQGVSIAALDKGLQSIGVKHNEVLIYSKLMDASSLFLTANADTIYFFGVLDLSKGPMVLEVPPRVLGAIDDYWFRWVTDFGAPGPDRGEGGKYVIVPPGYEGQLPEGGFYVARSRTNKVLWFGRAFMEKSDPAPVAAAIKTQTKVFPYQVGGVGTSVASFLTGKARMGKIAEPPATVFHEGTGVPVNTVPPSDYSYYEMLNEIVQNEPATSLDPEQAGSLAAIGIVKGKPFAPDERMKKILEEAAALGNASSRSLFMAPRDESWFYYPNSSWSNLLFQTGYQFETPIPEITTSGVKPYPSTGYRTLDGRTYFFYGITGITPGMAMRLPGLGSQYLLTMADSNKEFFDGGKTYKVVLPKGIPEANFWSFTLYDNQTRSMLDTPQRYPRAGSQSFPSPAAKAGADGVTTIYFGPSQPKGIARGNWIQTMPGKGYFVILRLYSPLEPFFTREWRPSEVELVRQ